MFYNQCTSGMRTAALITGFLGGILFADPHALADTPVSPHLADLNAPDTGPMSDYVGNAMKSVTKISNSVFGNEDVNRDVMQNLADGTKSQINQAKIAAEACDREAYDAAIAKIDAWAGTLDGLVTDAEKIMGGLVGPGSISNTADDVSKPFDQRAKSLKSRKAKAQKALDAAAKAHNIGPAILPKLTNPPADIAGPLSEIEGYDKALSELSGMTLDLDLLDGQYRSTHKKGAGLLKALKEWQAKLQAARADIPPFPENCSRSASNDTSIGLGETVPSTGLSEGTLAVMDAGILSHPPEVVIADLFFPPKPAVTFSAGGTAGQLDRKSTGMLGTDNAMVISPLNLIQLDNDEDASGYFTSTNLNTTGLDNQLWGDWFSIDPSTSFSTGFNLAHVESTAEQWFDMIPVGAGNNLLLFSPEGIGGGLGGGLNAGPRDVENAFYSNNYERDVYEIKKEVSFDTSFGQLSPNVNFGYGDTEIYQRFSGKVAGINQDFAYHSMLDVDTFMLGFGVNVEIPVGKIAGKPVEFYAGASATAQFNDHSGYSKLNLSGIINAEEIKYLSGSETTGAYEANVGLSFQINDALEFVIGAQVKRYDIAGIEIMPEQEARVSYDSATEYTANAALKFSFGGGSSPDMQIYDRPSPVTAQTPLQVVTQTPRYPETATSCGSNANIAFSQLSLQLDGNSHNNTGWGRAHLSYYGNPNVSTQFLNLVVNNATVARNLPLRPGDKSKQQIDLMFWINLGVSDGTQVDRITYGCSVTPNRPIGAPDDEETAEVKDEKIELWSDFWKETLTYQGPQTEKDRLWYPSTEYDVIDSAFHIWELIKNQECGPQECFPTAISNSFKMMLRSHTKKLEHLSDDPDKDNDATDIKTFKTGPWTGWVEPYPSGAPASLGVGGGSKSGRSNDPEAGFNKFKNKLESDPDYPFEVEIIDDPKDLDKILEVIKKKGDCKLLGNAHAMLITGVISLTNGDYLFEIADDSKQGKDGGTDVRLVKYDTSANEFSGYVLGGSSMTKGEGTSGGNVIFVCETVK